MTPEEIAQLLALTTAVKERQRQENVRVWTERFDAWCATHPLPSPPPNPKE